MVLVLNRLLICRKKMLVMMMKSAGKLTINWIRMSGASAKCCLMTASPGAMAAPAMTVSSDIERIVAVTLFVTFWFMIQSE